MRTPFKASSRAAAPLILATACFSLLALHCSSDDTSGGPVGTAGTTTSTSGSGGSISSGGSVSSAGMTAGGSASGSPNGGTGTSGAAGTLGTAGTGGSSAGGSGGGSGGAGGSSGGSGGASGSGGGGNSTTFAAVKELMGKSCGTGKCHNAASGELNYQDVANLYKTLTTAVPDTAKHCAGNDQVIKPNDMNSLLIKAINGATSCMNKGASQNIGRMPDDCPGDRPCLTADQIKVFTDWVAAGAPM